MVKEVVLGGENMNQRPRDMEALFPLAHALVEATHFEKFALWKEYHHRKEEHLWVDHSQGFSLQIGTLDNRPVWITCWSAIIEGKFIVFYECTSQVVDWLMIETWLKANFKANIKMVDAMNFHNALIA